MELSTRNLGDNNSDEMVVRINTHGETHPHIQADQKIKTTDSDSAKRRTVKLERSKANCPWGFTLQSYGIYNAEKKRIEQYTYVDYVDLKSPALNAGMKKGDIIFAVNGQSTEEFTHEELVSKIKTCKNSMRMVLVNANICQKIELHQRRQKLQALLRQKQSELKGLEKREAALFYNARARQRQMELRLRADADKEAAQTMTNQSCSASSHPQQMGDGDRHAATTTNSANTPANGSLDVRPKTTIGSRKQDIGHNVIGQTTDSRDHQHTRGNKPH